MSPGRSFLAEEVIQSSRMDCGPASLKCFLAGFGVRTSYDRLREACQTELDGTSIDTMEDVANALGVPAAQFLVPKDALGELAPAVAPAVVVARLPGVGPHFVVLWRRAGGLFHVMDPASGRRWATPRAFAEGAYVHEQALDAGDWLALSMGGPMRPWLVGRLRRAGLGDRAGAYLREAVEADGWRGLAALDAAARLVAGGARARRDGGAALARCYELALADLGRDEPGALPRAFYSAWPEPPEDGGGGERVVVAGALLLAAHGDAAAVPAEGAVARAALHAAVAEPPPNPWRELAPFLGRDGAVALRALVVGLALSASGTVLEAVLFRAAFSLLAQLGVLPQRLSLAALLAGFLALLLALECALGLLAQRVGGGLELRLRAATLLKVPRLVDAYLRSRLVSDLAQRMQRLHLVRELPRYGQQLGRAALDLLVTLVAIALLDPPSAPVAAVGALTALLLPLATNRALVEHDMRVQAQGGALSSVYFDALQGLAAVLAHGARRAMRVEQESLLIGWARAARGRNRALTRVSTAQAAVGVVTLVALVRGYHARHPEAQGLLLLLFWAQRLPALGQGVAAMLRQYPTVRNALLRAVEPLRAAERAAAAASPGPERAEGAEGPGVAGEGVAIAFEGVGVHAGGRPVLEGVTCALRPGEHVAVVGRSGAGKSSLVGLLLGWHRPSEGRVLVDGRPLDEVGLERLRRRTAWVDPAVQLWNAPLLDNLAFGAESHPLRPLGRVLEEADLLGVLERLPRGLRTGLGDGGALVSGGEGQRARLGRALLRDDVRLVILDEPFRGVDRDRRRALLGRVRRAWPRATLLCVTHDVAETVEFPRVWVVEGGRLAEDDAPGELARAGTQYRALLEADRRAGASSWSARLWRSVRVADGRVSEAAAAPPGGAAP